MIHVVTCFWNCKEYLSRCLQSVSGQSETGYLVHLVDDMSTDGSYEECMKLIAKDKRLRLTRNAPKKYKLKSIDEIISDTSIMKDEDVIVELDGDDHLAHKDVLKRVREIYSNPKTMICNARHVFSDGKMGYSRHVDVTKIRHSPFEFTHLRTWRAGLWRNVDKRYFVDPADSSGGYFKTAVDVAYSFPMLELAGQEGYKHCEEVMLVYNDKNPRNSHKPGSALGGIGAQNSSCIRARLLNFSNNPNFDRQKIDHYIETEPRYKLDNQSSPA